MIPPNIDEDLCQSNSPSGQSSGKRSPLALARRDLAELDRRAEELGVEPATLIRMWVEERLHMEAS